MLTIYKQVHPIVESYEQQQLAAQNGTLVTRLVTELSVTKQTENTFVLVFCTLAYNLNAV